MTIAPPPCEATTILDSTLSNKHNTHSPSAPKRGCRVGDAGSRDSADIDIPAPRLLPTTFRRVFVVCPGRPSSLRPRSGATLSSAPSQPARVEGWIQRDGWYSR